jgi:hypothetical protein
MLFLVFGSSAAGKTAALTVLRTWRLPYLAIHDFDEIGVPPGATRHWRQRSTEAWVRRALGYEREGRDLLLAGQTPLGEALAAPSAARLEGISACLLDCDDESRLARLHADWRPESSGRSPPIGDLLAWAAWMRRHAEDPRFEPDVIKGDCLPDMRWERWSEWEADHPRWRVRVIDTSTLSVEEVATELSSWIETERAGRR